jgi:putative ABC transport system substrate-binding protein
MASYIRRRKFLATLLGGAAAAWPLSARTQQPKVPTIGALVIGNISPEEFWREFRQGLRDLGYNEGQNIRFEFRSAEGQIDRLPELAAELVRLKVDVIVTWFTPTAVAAKQATRDIPIVMAETGDPIGTGLVASLPRPGGNVTGVAAVTAELAGKSVQLIRDMLPSARRVTALANATDAFSKPFLEQIQLGGKATGTAINPIRIGNNEEFESAFAAMERDRPDAIIVQPSLPSKRGRAGAATPGAGSFGAALVRRRRRADVVLRDLCGPFSQGCRLCRQNPQRRPTSRFAGRAANSFPTGHQYENCQCTWH